MADDILRVLGLAQGAQFVWVAVGGGTVLAAIAAGVAAVGALPWWSVALTFLGSFVLTCTLIAAVIGRSLGPKRLDRINRLFAEQEAIRALVLPLATPDPPPGMEQRVERFRTDVDKFLRADPMMYRAWLSVAHRYATVRVSPAADDPEHRAWRAATLILMADSDAILQTVAARLASAALRPPDAAGRGR